MENMKNIIHIYGTGRRGTVIEVVHRKNDVEEKRIAITEELWSRLVFKNSTLISNCDVNIGGNKDDEG